MLAARWLASAVRPSSSGSISVTEPGASVMLALSSEPSFGVSRWIVPRVSTVVVDSRMPDWLSAWPTSEMSPWSATTMPLLGHAAGGEGDAHRHVGDQAAGVLVP